MIEKTLIIYLGITIASIIFPFLILPICLITENLNIKELIKDILPTLYKYTFYVWLYMCILVIPICYLIAYIVNLIFK